MNNFLLCLVLLTSATAAAVSPNQQLATMNVSAGTLENAVALGQRAATIAINRVYSARDTLQKVNALILKYPALRTMYKSYGPIPPYNTSLGFVTGSNLQTHVLGQEGLIWANADLANKSALSSKDCLRLVYANSANAALVKIYSDCVRTQAQNAIEAAKRASAYNQKARQDWDDLLRMRFVSNISGMTAPLWNLFVYNYRFNITPYAPLTVLQGGL